ncbi:MAG: Ig-like domain-containing protein [Cyanobacteria bacterium J06638_28]
MSTKYSLSDLTFNSENQALNSTGSGSGIDVSETFQLASWQNEGFNIDAFLDEIIITPAIPVKNPFTRKTLFTIPAITIPINTGIEWDLNTSGDLDFELGFAATGGNIDSELNYDVSFDFVDLFRVESGQSFALADNATTTVNTGSFNATSPDLSAFAKINYDVDFSSDLDIEIFGNSLIPPVIDDVIGNINIDEMGDYTIAEADINGIRLLQTPSLTSNGFGDPTPGRTFLLDIDLFDQKISFKADPLTKRIDVSTESEKLQSEIGQGGTAKPRFTYDLGNISFAFPRVKTTGDLNDSTKVVEGTGSSKFLDFNVDIDGFLSTFTPLPPFGVKFDAGQDGKAKAIEISADFIDVEAGPFIALGQNFDLTPGDLQTTFVFQDLDENSTTVEINGEQVSEFTAPSFNDIPNLVLTEPVRVIPTFQPNAQLQSQTTLDLGLEITFDLIKAEYKIKNIFSSKPSQKDRVLANGKIGPLFSTTFDTVDSIPIGGSSTPFALEGWNSFAGNPIILDVAGSGLNAGVSGIDDGVNDSAPVANDDALITDEDTDLIIDVATLLANDFDPDARDTLTITTVSATTGTAILNAEGTVIYSPNSMFENLAVSESATDTITYTIRDDVGRTATAQAQVTVEGVNDSPVATEDAVSIFGDFSNIFFLQEGTTFEVALLANDSDPDSSDILSLVELDQILTTDLGSDISFQEISGNYSDGGNGLGFDGTELNEVGEVKFDRVEYTVSDGNGGTDTAEAYFVLFGNDSDPNTPGYDAGFVVSQSAFTLAEGDEPGTFVIALQAEPTSDVDIIITPSSTDDVILSANTEFVAPNTIRFEQATWDVPKVIAVSAVADSLTEVEETVTLTLTPSSADTDYSAVSSQDITLTIQDAPGILVSASAVTVSESGTTAAFDVTLTTQPSSNVVLQVVADDTSEATVSTSSLTFNANNWDQPQTVTVTGVDDDVLDGDQIAAITLAVDAGQSDNAYDTVEAVTIQATVEDDENALPVGIFDEATTNEDTAVVIDVLANDTDPEGEDLIITSVTPLNGTAVINNDNTITYTPNADFNGTGFVNYTVSDGTDEVESIAIVTVDAVNDDPIALDQLDVAEEDTPVTIDVIGDDVDVDGDTLTLDSITSVVNGSVDIVDGQAVFTPDADFTNATVAVVNGEAIYTFDADAQSAGFEYVVSDGNGGTDTGTVIVAVTPSNDAPVAVADALTIDEDTLLTIDPAVLLGNDTDIDLPAGEELTLVETDDTNSQGYVFANSDGTLSYDPRNATNEGITQATVTSGGELDEKTGFDFLDDGETATDTFTYTIEDNLTEQSTGTVTITVTGVNDAPEAVDDFFQALTTSGSTDTIQFGNLLANDVDPDTSDTLTAITEVIVTKQFNPGDDPEGEPTGSDVATVTINADGTFSYEYEGNLALGSGEAYFDTFGYQVTDGDVIATTTATVVTIGAPGTPGFVLSESELEVQEAAKINQFLIALTAQPTSDVTLLVNSSAPMDLVTDVATVTFTPDNWNTPQLVQVAALDDQQVELTEVATLTVAVDPTSDSDFTGRPDQTIEVTILDKEIVPAIVVSEQLLTLDEGGATGEFLVSLATEPTSTVVVDIVSNDTDVATVSTSTLTFGPGDFTNKSVTVTPGDDEVVGLNGITSIFLNVDPDQSDDAYDAVNEALVVVGVLENDTLPTVENSLILSFDTDTIAENGGVATATVSRNGDTTAALTVALANSDASEVDVPDTVTIPVGENSATFTVTALDDNDFDGPQVVFITPSADGYFNGFTSLTVTDDDATLSVSIDPTDISENGGIATGTVTRSTPTNDTSTPLIVNLSSSDTTEATVLDAVTIPIGETSATFTITGVDDNLADGTQTVAITASAISFGFSDDSASLSVTDDEGGTTGVPTVNGQLATIYVDDTDTVVGNAFQAGEQPYQGSLFSNTDAEFNTGESPDDVILGTSGSDEIWAGNEGNDLIETGAGNDIIGLSLGNVTVSAGSDDDFVYALSPGDGTNTIDLGSGTDEFWAEGGNNTITGSGNNTIGLGGGNDSVTTGAGVDFIYSINGGGGTNVLDLGNGDNIIYVENGDYTLTTGSGNDTIGLGTGSDVVNAGDGNNTIYVIDAATAGNKDILTGSGDDFGQTGAGTDRLDGGLGFNTLEGGSGADTFVYRTGAYNAVLDFELGTDQIELANVTFDELTFFQGVGSQAADVFIFVGSEALGEVANITVAELDSSANFG